MDGALRVVVDGVIYRMQAYGGISRLYNEILPRMCELDGSLRITLLTERKIRQPLPQHPHIHHRIIPRIDRHLYPRYMWKPIVPLITSLVHQAWVGSGRGQIWHSTFFTLPERWKGWQVVTVLDMTHEHFSHLFNKPWDEGIRERKRHCILAADAVICISETTSKDIQRFYRIDTRKIRIIPLACSEIFRQVERECKSFLLPTDKPFLLYVGSRDHYKNFHSLLSAYSMWAGRSEIALVVVGQRWSPEERQRLVELRLQGRVFLLENVDDETLCKLYNQAVALVYPSLYEGFGIPLLEAMACGCPIVASRIPSTLEVAEDIPIYFEPGETEDLLSALDHVLEEGKRSLRVSKGLKHVKKYSWERTAKQTLDVYKSLV